MDRLSKTILTNLDKVFSRATREEYAEGYHWYDNAHDLAVDIADHYNTSTNAVIGAIAALSPGMPWERNVTAVKSLLRALPKELNLSPYGKANDEKAYEIARGGNPARILAGPKVTSFYHCILDPRNTEHVVIDRLMAQAAHLRNLEETEYKSMWRTPARYAWWAEHVRVLAQEHSLTPAQYQAIVWTVWKAFGSRANVEYKPMVTAEQLLAVGKGKQRKVAAQ